MANISTKFGLSGGGGSNFSDPRRFFRGLYAAAKLGAQEGGAGTNSLSTAAGFFTEMAIRGVSDNTNWTADTYKTILSVSGVMGALAAIGGPTGLAGTPTTTFRITVDGIPQVIAVVATTTGQRACLGAIPTQDTTGLMFVTAGYSNFGANSINAGKDTQVFSSTQMSLMPWSTINFLGTPRLEFNTSLLVEMKTSESNSTTTNQERQSFVQYMVQP